MAKSKTELNVEIIPVANPAIMFVAAPVLDCWTIFKIGFLPSFAPISLSCGASVKSGQERKSRRDDSGSNMSTRKQPKEMPQHSVYLNNNCTVVINTVADVFLPTTKFCNINGRDHGRGPVLCCYAFHYSFVYISSALRLVGDASNTAK